MLFRQTGPLLYSIADDDGIDLLVYDKQTGAAIPIQVKSRTTTLKNSTSGEPGTGVHFEVRSSALREFDQAHLVAVLLTANLTDIQCAWLIPMRQLPGLARVTEEKLVIRPSASKNSLDKFSPFRCNTTLQLAQRLALALDKQASRVAKGKLGD